MTGKDVIDQDLNKLEKGYYSDNQQPCNRFLFIFQAFCENNKTEVIQNFLFNSKTGDPLGYLNGSHENTISNVGVSLQIQCNIDELLTKGSIVTISYD